MLASPPDNAAPRALVPDLTRCRSVNLNQQSYLANCVDPDGAADSVRIVSFRVFSDAILSSVPAGPVRPSLRPAYHLICGTDDEAIERARRLVGLRFFELWNVDRLVLRLEGRRAHPIDPTGASK